MDTYTPENFTVNIDGVNYDVREVFEDGSMAFFVFVLGQELRFECNENIDLRPVNINTIDDDPVAVIGNAIEDHLA